MQVEVEGRAQARGATTDEARAAPAGRTDETRTDAAREGGVGGDAQELATQKSSLVEQVAPRRSLRIPRAKKSKKANQSKVGKSKKARGRGVPYLDPKRQPPSEHARVLVQFDGIPARTRIYHIYPVQYLMICASFASLQYDGLLRYWPGYSQYWVFG